MELTPAEIISLKKEFEKISNWDAWETFTKRYFDWDNTPCRTLAQIEADLARANIHRAHQIWEPFAANYVINSDIEVLFESLSSKIFAKLEAKAHKYNLEHPELFAWKCMSCRMYTRIKTKKCALCGKPLLPMPLNE